MKKDKKPMPAKSSQKMRFGEDKFYTDPNTPLYLKDEIYDVPGNMVDRWLKRGGVIVTDEVILPKPAPAPAPVEPPKAEPPPVIEPPKVEEKDEDILGAGDEEKEPLEPPVKKADTKPAFMRRQQQGNKPRR